MTFQQLPWPLRRLALWILNTANWIQVQITLFWLAVELAGVRLLQRIARRNRKAQRECMARPPSNLARLRDFSADCSTTPSGIYRLAHAASNPAKAGNTRKLVRDGMILAVAISLLIYFRLRQRMWFVFLRWFSQSNLLHRAIIPVTWKLFVGGIKSVVRFASRNEKVAGKLS